MMGTRIDTRMGTIGNRIGTIVTRMCTTSTIRWVRLLLSISTAYIDFKSAFDCISHPKLLKLASYGIKGNFYLWIQAFLINRSQYVNINSSYSLPCSVSSGVIHGSVIGSLLFNIFINDITDHFHPNTTVKLFADDIKLYTTYT